MLYEKSRFFLIARGVQLEHRVNPPCSDARSWCWIGDGERVGPQHIHQSVKHGGGPVIIWGCMRAFGEGGSMAQN